MKIYLAIPYSGMAEESFRIANEVSAKLMNEGHIVFSPISHSHPIAIAHNLPTDWIFGRSLMKVSLNGAMNCGLLLLERMGMNCAINQKG